MVYYQLSVYKKIRKLWKKEKYCKKIKRMRTPCKSIEIIMMRIFERSRRIKTLEQIYKRVTITKILDEVIGSDYFGTTENRKRFYHLVNKISTQSRFECVYLSTLSKGYNLKVIPWLQEECNLNEKQCRNLLQRTNLYLLSYVVKPLIKHFYHALNSFRGYEIKFIERSKWHSFQHNILNDLLRLNYLTPEDKEKFRSRATLRLCPKTNCDSLEYRPLISPIKYSIVAKAKFKYISKKIEHLARQTSIIGKMSLFLAWKRFTRETAGKRIYGIKLDIRDAFGNINIEELCIIVKKSNMSDSDKQFIINHVQNQYVSFQKKIYRWNHGLLQGDRLSSSLCNLFFSNFEKDNLMLFCKPRRFLHRIADDYFFCSVEKTDIDLFESKVKNKFQLNETKTQLVVSDNDFSISYFGQVFNLQTREVCKEHNFKKDVSIRHKFKFWNIINPVPEQYKGDIILKTLDFCYNNHCFKRMELNTKFNSGEKVLKNYFEGMVFIAFKFEAAVMSIREYKQTIDDMPPLKLILEQVIYNYTNIVFFKIQRCKGERYTGNITFGLLKNIAYRAFVLVLKQSYEFYKSLICYIEKKNSLYLCLQEFKISCEFFSKLPEVFCNVRLGRRTRI